MEASYKNLAQVASRKITVDPRRLEHEVVTELSTKVLIPIFGKSLDLEDVCHYNSLKEDATVTNIGMGSSSTFHGTPDIRINGCPVVFTAVHNTVKEEEGETDHRTGYTPQSTITFTNIRIYTWL